MHANDTVHDLLVVGIAVLLFAGVAIPGAVAAQDTSDNGTMTDNGTAPANGTAVATTAAMANGTPTSNETGPTNTTGPANETGPANGTAGATASLTANPTGAGVFSNHTVNITIGDAAAGNLTGVSVNYTGTNVSTDPVPANVSRVTLADRTLPSPSNMTIAQFNSNITDISFDLNESLQPEAGDQLTLFYSVRHPPTAGNHTAEVLLNPETDAVALTTNVTITEREATPTAAAGTTTIPVDDETTTEEATTEETMTEETTTEEPTPEETTAQETTTSSGNGPGFTAFVGIVSVLVLALLAIRRD